MMTRYLLIPLLALALSHLQLISAEEECAECWEICDYHDFHLATECNCCMVVSDDGTCKQCYRPGRPSCYHPESRYSFDLGMRGIWMTDDPPLFRPFLADPRQQTYSVGRRYNDNALPKNTIPISYWDTFPIYRMFGVKPWAGMLQFELEGALWAIFDPDTFSAPLINADYYVSFTTSYAFCNWSFRLRFYHISSHIGDEYLLNHPDFDRRNPSGETLDFFVSQDLTNEIRWYAGVGWIITCDESFPVKRFLSQAGMELRIPRLGFHSRNLSICGRPFFAMNFLYKLDFKNHIDSTYVLGYEFSKCCGARKRMRVFIEYHDGYCVEGQFCRKATNYFSCNLSYGY